MKNHLYISVDRLLQKKIKETKMLKKNLLCLCIEHVCETSKFTEQLDKSMIYANKFSTSLLKIPVKTQLGQELKESNNLNLELMDLLSQTNSRNIFTDGSKITTLTHVGCSCICSDLDIFVKKKYT